MLTCLKVLFTSANESVITQSSRTAGALVHASVLLASMSRSDLSSFVLPFVFVWAGRELGGLSMFVFLLFSSSLSPDPYSCSDEEEDEIHYIRSQHKRHLARLVGSRH